VSAPRVLVDFDKLLAWRRTTGFIALVRPGTFDDQVETHRRIRDALALGAKG
jgi:hypothetical protein